MKNNCIKTKNCKKYFLSEKNKIAWARKKQYRKTKPKTNTSVNVLNRNKRNDANSSVPNNVGAGSVVAQIAEDGPARLL